MIEENEGAGRVVGRDELEAAEARLRAAEAETARLRREVEALQARNLPGTLTNGMGMEFVLIPAGRFWMGRPGPDPKHREQDPFFWERPCHEVTIPQPFYLGRTPVTQAQWEAVMGTNPSCFRGAYRPVEGVGWHDVQRFIARLNAREGHRRCRLPTEAEWEYACRAGGEADYCFGNDRKRLEEYAWYADNSGPGTRPVGLKRPNAWGLHDMHGNVWEWVQDWFGEYSPGPATDPRGPIEGGNRALRGGGWNSDAESCRTSCRCRFAGDAGYDDRGFRLVCIPDPGPPVSRTLRNLSATGPDAETARLRREVEALRGLPTTLIDDLGVEFVLIPAGRFWMGSGEHEPMESGRHPFCLERPCHEVTISRPFYLARYPVTQAQWEAIMGDNPSRFRGADRPVERVSWHDAQRFIELLNLREGHPRRFRLPTEAEWEYACRAGGATTYCFGDEWEQLAEYAWYADNSGLETQPVGLKRPNAWGLHDMHGNVWEWVRDRWNSYGPDPATDPRGPTSGRNRVLRGGCMSADVWDCRSACRRDAGPTDRLDHAGFRLARNVPDL